MFNKILIANRGEIACRVMSTARRLGIATVAVYSDADAGALHVQLADEAVHIGPAPARESYLDIDAILRAAQATGAEAIHPGYGFLSENAAFAQACADASVVFIGPPASAIEAMGSKAAAKRIMEQAEVPLVPGYHGENQSAGRLRAAAEEMGYPVLLKATAGGGGKGMRQVDSGEEFEAALDAARREAAASFGDDSMLVEKYLTRPRHVEIQVFCDSQGNGVYLAERDCSVQRRHQKVIEEAPAPGVSAELRRAMGDTAVKAAAAIDYRGAGTVEFLLDEDGSFYFMEMNTRLQVEHPVTEMITGQDLVEWQLLVAAGQALPLAQEQVSISGHAFEARIYAEDPENDFLPVTGTLDFLRAPEETRHVRVDTGVQQGDEISVYYDPMIAKLVTWDESRERALARLARALASYRVGGTTTNIDFLYNLATCEPFSRARLDTRFIERHRQEIFRDRDQDLATQLPRAALALLLATTRGDDHAGAADPGSPWNRADAWRLNQPHVHRFELRCHQQDHRVAIEQRDGAYHIDVDGQQSVLRGELLGDSLLLEAEGHRQRGVLAATGPGYTLYLPEGSCQFQLLAPDTGTGAAGASDGQLTAPMNGTIVALLVEPDTVVEAGTPLLVLEAMKMEHAIKAPCPGTVTAFFCARGDLVDGGAELLAFTPAQE
ncbi:MAG: acetyl/propionyl/methylcrotonyl-CoA carboxylase subunit alpha [Halioglobus sp.]|nr:acetyl/propionyl/methylcrotonyl-CoA carboxylase subunit alpha [Halioglobus sp.]